MLSPRKWQYRIFFVVTILKKERVEIQKRYRALFSVNVELQSLSYFFTISNLENFWKQIEDFDAPLM